MPVIKRSALVRHSAEQMFDLINDIERYPDFMQGCKAARVISKSDNTLEGELTLAKAGMQQTFTTRNALHRPERIDMELVSGKFKNFSAHWQFQPLGRDACKVSLHMDFEFDSALVDFAAGKLFSSVANDQVDSLVTRADQLYGS